MFEYHRILTLDAPPVEIVRIKNRQQWLCSIHGPTLSCEHTKSVEDDRRRILRLRMEENKEE